VEAGIIRQLVEQGVIVVCLGGGGTPVYRDPVLRLEGVDAVIDKDHAAAVLGGEIGAEALLILTNVEGAYRGFGTPAQELLRQLTVDQAEALLRAGEFGTGSMGPKIEAALAFIRAGGRFATWRGSIAGSMPCAARRARRCTPEAESDVAEPGAQPGGHFMQAGTAVTGRTEGQG